jgi:hypothetical protein
MGLSEQAHGVSHPFSDGEASYEDTCSRCTSQTHTRSPSSLLSDSIIAFMDQYEMQGDDDRIRHFFRHHVRCDPPPYMQTTELMT